MYVRNDVKIDEAPAEEIEDSPKKNGASNGREYNGRKHHEADDRTVKRTPVELV